MVVFLLELNTIHCKTKQLNDIWDKTFAHFAEGLRARILHEFLETKSKGLA